MSGSGAAVPTVAFLGLGRMGAPMAANLARAGVDLRLYNRSLDKAVALADEVGASVASSPRAAAGDADVVITMLADEAAVLAVYEGDDGVLAGLRPGAIVVDMGTTGPQGVRRLAARVTAVDASFADVPVSGSTAAAEAAELTIMVGAEDPVLARLDPVLAAMGSTRYHLGGPGAGSVAKLAVNNIIYALGNALAESLVLAERAGLGRGAIYEVFEHSAVAAPMVHYRRDAYLDPEHTPVSFALTLARKDLGLIVDLAEDLGVPVMQATANRSLIGAAVEAGLGDRDMADVAVHLRRLAGP